MRRGSTNNANMGKKFNSFEKRDYVIDLFKFDDDELGRQRKAAFRKILQAFSVIFRIFNSWRRKIKVDNFGQYLLDLHMALHDIFEEMDDNSVFSCSIDFFKF